MPDTIERPAIDDTGSLSDHEATYQPKRGEAPAPAVVQTPTPAVEPAPVVDPAEAVEAALEEARDPNGRFRPKHRAEKDKARPGDVPRIRELSGKVKDLEKERDEWKTKWEAAQRPPAPTTATPMTPIAAVTPPAQTAAPAFTQPEPKIEDFAKDDDPYLALNRAWAKWDRQREKFEDDQTAAQQAAKAQAEQADTAARTAYTQGLQGFYQRRDAYTQQHPDHAASFSQEALNAMPGTPLIEALLIQADNGPELVYTLQHRPDLLAELVLVTDGKPVSAQHVALATQWLQTRVQAGTTAAAAPRTIKPPPKPPTAVRTGPMQTGSEPPGDGASLADHEAYYTRKRR